MAYELLEVQPGQLITSQFFNVILSNLRDIYKEIEDHEGRLRKLESGPEIVGNLYVTDVIPDGPYRIGDSIEVRGHNFQWSIGAARVYFNETRVVSFSPDSTDTRLIFTIPPVTGVSETGTQVFLTVANQSERYSKAVVLKPKLIPLQGNVDVTYKGVEPATIEQDKSAYFKYTLRSRATVAADFLITPDIEVDTNESLWESNTHVLDNDKNPIPLRKITLESGEEKVFYIGLLPVPDGTDGTTFDLTVYAEAGSAKGTHLQTFTVGEAPIPKDDTITLYLDFPTDIGDTVELSIGNELLIGLTADFQLPVPRDQLPQIYNITTHLGSTTSNWVIEREIFTPASYELGNNDFGADDTATRLPKFKIRPIAGASADGFVEVRIQREGETIYQSFKLKVKLI